MIKQKSSRQSNFELLRIISMVLIVCHHYAGYSRFSLQTMQVPFNKVWLQFLLYGGRMGVNLFVLISGYFLVTSGFKGKKAIKLWVDVTLYSAIFLIIFILGGQEIGIKEIVKNILPLPYNMWWFATTYFVLFILSGYINIFVKALTQKQLDFLIVLLILICSVLPMFLIYWASSKLMWFFLLYLIAARIRLYPPKKKIFDYSLYIGIIGYLLCLISCVIFNIIGNKISFFSDKALYFAGMEKPTMLFCAVFLFIGFKNINMGSRKFINAVASSTFGIYLIHENTFVRGFLWQNILGIANYDYSRTLIIHSLAAICITFSFCSLLSFIYNKTIGRCVEIIIEKTYDTIKQRIQRLFLFVSDVIGRL